MLCLCWYHFGVSLEMEYQGTIEMEVQRLKFVPASKDAVGAILPDTEGHYARGKGNMNFEPVSLEEQSCLTPLSPIHVCASPVGPSALKAMDSNDPLSKYNLSALPKSVSLADQCLCNQATINME